MDKVYSDTFFQRGWNKCKQQPFVPLGSSSLESLVTTKLMRDLQVPLSLFGLFWVPSASSSEATARTSTAFSASASLHKEPLLLPC